MTDREVARVLEAVPEFVDRYLTLVEMGDGEPGPGTVFDELADYLAGVLAGVGPFLPTLERCLAAVEEVAAHSPDADELVVWSFFDNLSPDDVRLLRPWLGPRTRALLDEVDGAVRRDPRVNFD